jgi:cobalamin synthase
MNNKLSLQAGITAFGILAVVVLYIFTVQVFQHASNPYQDIAAVLSPVISVIAALVGAIAGHAAGEQSGQAAAAASKDLATSTQNKLNAVLAASHPDTLAEAQKANPDAFK